MLRIAIPVLLIVVILHLTFSVLTYKEQRTPDGLDYISKGGRIGTIEAIFVHGYLGWFSLIFMGLIIYWSIAFLARAKAKGVLILSGKILLLWLFMILIFGLIGLDSMTGLSGSFLATQARSFLGNFGAWIFTLGFFMLFLWFMIGMDYIVPLVSKVSTKLRERKQSRMEEKARKRAEIMKEYQERTRTRYEKLNQLKKTTTETTEIPLLQTEKEKPSLSPEKKQTANMGYGTFSIDVSKFLDRQEQLRKEKDRIERATVDLTGDEYDMPSREKKEAEAHESRDSFAISYNDQDLSSEYGLSGKDTEIDLTDQIVGEPDGVSSAAISNEIDQTQPEQINSSTDQQETPKAIDAVSEGLEKAREIAVMQNAPQEKNISLRRGDAASELEGRGIYYFENPSLENLIEPDNWGFSVDEHRVHQQSVLLEETLAHFKINGEITRVTPGPVITRFEYRPEKGVKISKISNLSDDLAMALKAVSIRIIAPIPGKDVVGIEIPNPKRKTVHIKEIILSEEFRDTNATLPLALGSAVDGRSVVTDLAKAPHLLVAGATGSGKSVCVNTIITSLVYSQTPSNLRLLMIDPKRLELSVYRDLPFMISEPIVEPEDAVIAFNWAVEEMTSRYRMLADIGVRDLKEFNRKVKGNPDLEMEPLPRIVIIVDELADLMMTSASQIEEPIARLAQMARAVGIHLILATQRPSVDVLTGLIKANFPSRIAFTVRSQIDSRTIIDMSGAEKLLGYGDMLFLNSSLGEPMRIHGSLITTEETDNIVSDLSKYKCPYEMEEFKAEEEAGPLGMDGSFDEYIAEAAKLVVINQKGSASMLQRKMRIGYNRAGSLIDQMEFLGIVGPSQGSKPREVRVRDIDELIEILELKGLS